MFNRMEAYFLEVIKGKRKGLFASFLKGALRLLSWSYQIGVACRNWAFDRGWMRRYYPPVPVVISIGNIVAGGTGKTPVTLMMAQEFYTDFLIAILSRGYRSQAENLPAPVVLSKGEGPMHPAAYCGDEPYLLSQNLPKAFVFVGKDRHKASNMAAKAGVHLILLDDGMQHRRLARDFEVVVMDAYDPFGQGFFLPRGFLRESLKSLSRANLIILNHVYDHERFLSMKKQIASYSSAPLIGTKMEVEQIWNADGTAIETLKNKKVGIFCGIAHPEYFRHTVFNLGADIISHYSVPDHKSFNPEDLKKFAEKCKSQGAELIICTEKDWVKLEKAAIQSLPFGWIQMKLKIVEGSLEWSEFIENAKKDLVKRM